MKLSIEEKKRLRTIGHELKPIVTISSEGVSEGVLAELERALNDHELIKVKISAGDREDREAVSQYLIEQTQCVIVQKIGKVLLVLRRNPNAKPKLSNLVRYQTL